MNCESSNYYEAGSYQLVCVRSYQQRHTVMLSHVLKDAQNHVSWTTNADHSFMMPIQRNVPSTESLQLLTKKKGRSRLRSLTYTNSVCTFLEFCSCNTHEDESLYPCGKHCSIDTLKEIMKSCTLFSAFVNRTMIESWLESRVTGRRKAESPLGRETSRLRNFR